MTVRAFLRQSTWPRSSAIPRRIARACTAGMCTATAVADRPQIDLVLQPWDALSAWLRNSNRALVDDIPDKLAPSASAWLARRGSRRRGGRARGGGGEHRAARRAGARPVHRRTADQRLDQRGARSCAVHVAAPEAVGEDRRGSQGRTTARCCRTCSPRCGGRDRVVPAHCDQPAAAKANGSTALAPARRRRRAATVIVQPVSITSSTSSTGPRRARRTSGSPTRVPHGREPLGRVGVRRRAAARAAGSGAEQRQPADLGDPPGQVRRAGAGGCASRMPTTPTGPLRPPPAREHPHARRPARPSAPAGRRRRSRRGRPSSSRSRGAPADVGEPPDRPAGLGLLACRDPPGQRYAERGHAGRPLLARRDLDARPVEAARGRRRRRPSRPRRRTTPCRCRCRSARTAPASGRRAGGAGTPCGTRRSSR